MAVDGLAVALLNLTVLNAREPILLVSHDSSQKGRVTFRLSSLHRTIGTTLNPVTTAIVVFMVSLAGLSAYTLVNGNFLTSYGAQVVLLLAFFLGTISGLLEWPGLKQRSTRNNN